MAAQKKSKKKAEKSGAKRSTTGAKRGRPRSRGELRDKTVGVRVSESTFEGLRELAGSVAESPTLYASDLLTAAVQRKKKSKRKKRGS